MIEGRDIVCFSNTTWEGVYVKSTVKLITELSRKNRVLFIEYPFTWKDLMFTLTGRQIAPSAKMLGIKSRLGVKTTPEGTQVYLLTPPPTLPSAFIKSYPVFKKALEINARIVRKSIQRAVRSLNMQDIIMINAYNPFYGLPLMHRLNESVNIYYCYDAINVRRFGSNGPAYEHEYIRHVDGVITSSANLAEKKKAFNPNVYVVKNGVDFNRFNSIYQHSQPFGNQKKIVGYIGSLDKRFEVDMISWVIEKLPDYDFEFVGRATNTEGKAMLEKYKNVKFKPPVSPDDVPQIMHDCHVGIIPYTRTEGNKNIYPLKINEYLAVGTPVVMTDFADLPEFKGLVSVAKTKEEFLDKIKWEIENNGPEKRAERVKLAAMNSWQARGEEFSEAIEHILDTKKIPERR